MTSWASFLDGLRSLQSLLADGTRFLSMRARMPSRIFWSSASTFVTYSFAYYACCSLSLLSLLCTKCSFLSGISALLNLDSLLDLNLHLMFSFFSASFAAIDVASSAICNCLLPLVLLFLCHLPSNSAASCFSTSISVSISTSCSLAFLVTFNSCSAAMR